MSINPITKDNVIQVLFFNLIKNKKWHTLLELIKDKQLNVNTRDKNGKNALYWAIQDANIATIKELIHLGIDLNVTLNQTALNFAVCKDNVKVIKCLKNCGVDINEIDDIGSTALIYAILYKKTNCMNYLCQCGADMNHEDFLGNSANNLIKKTQLR